MRPKNLVPRCLKNRQHVTVTAERPLQSKLLDNELHDTNKHRSIVMIIRERFTSRCWNVAATRNARINELLASAILRDMYYDAAERELVATADLVGAMRDAGFTIAGGEGRDYLEAQQ
nr:MAG TPA: hypothetical protein [Caudoviricetes sp.]